MKLFVYLMLCALWLSPTWAAEPSALPGATVHDVLSWLDQGSADLAVLRHETTGAQLRAESAGALPDPSFRIERQDLSGLSELPGQSGATKYTVLQPLPGWGKRDAQKQAAASAAQVAHEQERAASAVLHARAKIAFARYYQAHAALQLNEELRAFTESVATLAQSRYETGLATQQELIRAQLEKSALQSERIALQSEYGASKSSLNALLNRPAYAELAVPVALRDLPPPAVLNPDTLEQRLSQGNPQLAGQSAQTAVAYNNASLANKNLIPDFVLGVGSLQRSGQSGTWEAMIEFSIPLQRTSHGAHQREATEMQEAEQARLIAVEARLMGELREHYAALQGAREQEELTRQSVLPLAELAFNGALEGYRNGRVDFATLLDSKREIQKARLDELNARVAQQIHLAEIERLTGEDL